MNWKKKHTGLLPKIELKNVIYRGASVNILPKIDGKGSSRSIKNGRFGRRLSISSLSHINPSMCICDLLTSKNISIIFLTIPLNEKLFKAKQTHVSSSRVHIIGILLPSLANLLVYTEKIDQLMSLQFFNLFATVEKMKDSYEISNSNSNSNSNFMYLGGRSICSF